MTSTFTESVVEEAASLEAPVEVHPADAEGLLDPLGKVKAAVPGRPAIWLEGEENGG